MATLSNPGSTRIGRRPRLSDAETEERMLAAGLDVISTEGMTVSLEHLRLEDVIRAADVSRTSAYRRWPTKQAYLSDLLVAVARNTELIVETKATLDQLQSLLDERRTEFRTPEGRHRAFVDGLRISVQGNIAQLRSSPQWLTYLAVGATLTGLDEGLRADVAAALARQNEHFIERRMDAYHHVLRVLAYRVRAPLPGGVGLRLLSSTAGATMMGYLVQGMANPGLLTPNMTVAAFGGSPAPWSEAALAIAGGFLAFVEPDPDALVDEAHIAEGIAWLEERFRDVRASSPE